MESPAATVAADLHELTTPGLFGLVSAAEQAVGGPPEEEGPLYAARRQIYPQSVSGTFRRIKWIVLGVTLGVYYLLPFVRWDRGAHAPSQVVLLDLPNRRFYFFFIEIWPQEFYYVTGLLVLAALTLFLMNAVAGRVWCGYLCPQTVWTDLFYAIERRIEGDRREHILGDREPWTAKKVGRKALKHLVWLVVAWWTGGAWILYFADAPTLVVSLATGTAPFIAYAAIAILTFTTYSLAGHMREQVCLYMCPWPRIQAALTDEYALNVTYRYDRGEPRGSLKKNTQLREHGLPAGDCIDCLQCVNVCPTGVDIRNGANLGCIQCGLCIDACDAVMAKIGRPSRLIAYDTDANIAARVRGRPASVRILRARTVAYAIIIAVVGAVMLFALATRNPTGINVLHDRNPIFVRLSDGFLRNAYTIRIINKDQDPRVFRLFVEGLPDARVEIFGEQANILGYHDLAVGPDQTREFRVLVTARQAALTTPSVPLTFMVVDTVSGDRAIVPDHFLGPELRN